MWKDPDQAVLTYPLFAGGTLEFGWARSGGGMSVGTNPLMARVHIPPESGGHGTPRCWFLLKDKRSITKVRAEFDGMGGSVFLPDWLRADMYEHRCRQLEDALRSIAMGIELSGENPLGEAIVGFFRGKALAALDEGGSSEAR